MRTLLRRPDADDSLEVARAALAQTEQRILDLEAERTGAISAGDGDVYLAAVAKIDRELETMRANAAVHRDRIEAMLQRQREVDFARRAERKGTALADIGKRLAARLTAAHKLDAAVKQLRDAFIELDQADAALFADWPDVLPPARTLRFLQATTIDALSTRRQPRPLFSGLVRSAALHDPFDFAETIGRHNHELVAELQNAPIPQSHAEAA